MTKPTPDPTHSSWIASERRYHNEHADGYVEKYGRADIFQVPESAYLFSLLPPSPGLTVLEIACGPAISLGRHLRRNGRSVRYIGVDISDNLLRVGRQQVPGGSFLLADASRLPVKPNSVDVAVALGGLHHIPQLEETCRSMFDAVRPGGLVLLREPSPEAFGDRWEGDSEHERGIDPDELSAIAERHGAAVVGLERFNSECFHAIRHMLHATRLYHLVEPFESYWKLKTRVDVALSRSLGSRWPWFRGLDYCMAIRKAA